MLNLGGVLDVEIVAKKIEDWDIGSRELTTLYKMCLLSALIGERVEGSELELESELLSAFTDEHVIEPGLELLLFLNSSTKKRLERFFTFWGHEKQMDSFLSRFTIMLQTEPEKKGKLKNYLAGDSLPESWSKHSTWIRDRIGDKLKEFNPPVTDDKD